MVCVMDLLTLLSMCCFTPTWKNGAHGGRELFPSFSLLMDFDGGNTGGMEFLGISYCASSEYYDIHKSKCVKSVCRGGQVKVEGIFVSLNIINNGRAQC